MVGQGGLLQLVALGKQDVFLTGNPQMTWFKMVYRRYTNFATESQPMYFDGTPDFGKRITCLVPRRGDLLSQIILEVTLPALTVSTAADPNTKIPVPYVNSIGHALIQEITIEIGEQEIDRQNGEWMEIWSSYTTTKDKETGFYNMIGKVDSFTNTDPSLIGPINLYIPLRFWFCKNPGLALPLIALQYHPIRINLTLRPLNQLFFSLALTPNPSVTSFQGSITGTTLTIFDIYSGPISTGMVLSGPGIIPGTTITAIGAVELNGTGMYTVNTNYTGTVGPTIITGVSPLSGNTYCPNITVNPTSITSLMLWGDYIYLDVDERRRFVSNTHEYLIEQVQYTALIPVTPGATLASFPLEFNHPIRELFWYIQRDDMTRFHEYFNYSSLGTFETGIRQDILQSAILQLDGFDRFQERDSGYFRLVQPWQYHTVIPEDFFVYSYSFALRPEDCQPCGSMNASRIDSIILQVKLNPAVVTPNVTDHNPPVGNLHGRVYGINHNVLRIADGFGGVLFTI